VRPDAAARPEFVAAFRELAQRIEHVLVNTSKRNLPIKMFVAGGAALHFYTGARVSEDVDAVFSRRIALPENLEVAYLDADGAARLLYFDRQYNDTLGLLHEDAQEDAVPLSIDGIDPRVLEVRLLTPVDLAISKVGRFAEHDRADIAALALHGLIDARSFRQRAEAAAVAYVGDTSRLHGSIEMACKIIADAERRRIKPGAQKRARKKPAEK
jgi:hypothetical protein